MSWLKSFVESLERLLDKPPYLIFVFISTIFVIISLITQHYFQESWSFFLYSVIGAVWRYIERDFLRPFGDQRILIISIYHLGNLGLVVGLFLYLGYM